MGRKLKLGDFFRQVIITEGLAKKRSIPKFRRQIDKAAARAEDEGYPPGQQRIGNAIAFFTMQIHIKERRVKPFAFDQFESLLSP